MPHPRAEVVSDKFPTSGTDKMTNSQHMPGGGWAHLELTEPIKKVIQFFTFSQ